MSPVSLPQVLPSSSPNRPRASLRPYRRVMAGATAALLTAGLLTITTQAAQATPPATTGILIGWGGSWNGQADAPASLADQTVTAIAAGESHSLALTADGHVTAWGYGGNGQTDVPAGLADQTVTAIAASADHNLALTADGRVTAWGYNGEGESDVPTSLTDQTVTAIAAGRNHSLALTSDGRVTGWGRNGEGESDVPSSLADQTVTAIAAGDYHSLALTSDGHVTVWGYNGQGQTDVPTSLADQTVTAIAGGGYHSLALTSDGHVTGWGADWYGQTDAPSSLADQTVTAIAAGVYHSLALTSDGHVTAWGYNDDGETDVPTSLADRTVTAIAAGGYHSLAIYRATVAAAVTGVPTVTGTASVGKTLTGDDAEMTTDPAGATRTHQWLRDDAPISDATATTYTLTNDDAGHSISFQVGATADGYDDATPVTSEAVGPVDGGQTTLPAPSISGTPVVDGTLTGTLPEGLDPTDATITWQWYRGDIAVGDATSTYTPTAEDVGEVLTVTATATRDHFETESRSTDTDTAVARATFAEGPSATITGTGKVGETLTAGTGDISPTPGDIGYQWYADDDAIEGATDATYVLQAAQRHTSITVRVTATRAGYDDVTHASAAIDDIATELAPDLSFNADDTTLSRGQGAELDWDTSEADTVTASGAWTGARAISGSASVEPTALGTSTYVLEATNTNGTTRSQVSLEVTRPARTLGLTAPTGPRLAGRLLALTVRDLEAGEPYSIRAGGVRVAAGTAGSGLFTRSIVIPTGSRQGVVPISVTGSENDRTASTAITVLQPRVLGVRVPKRVVRTRHRQFVRVTGLVAGESVTVAYRGKRVTPLGATADRNGRFLATFRVGRLQGTKTVQVTGAFAVRHGTTRFLVRNR